MPVNPPSAHFFFKRVARSELGDAPRVLVIGRESRRVGALGHLAVEDLAQSVAALAVLVKSVLQSFSSCPRSSLRYFTEAYHKMHPKTKDVRPNHGISRAITLTYLKSCPGDSSCCCILLAPTRFLEVEELFCRTIGLVINVRLT